MGNELTVRLEEIKHKATRFLLNATYALNFAVSLVHAIPSSSLSVSRSKYFEFSANQSYIFPTTPFGSAFSYVPQQYCDRLTSGGKLKIMFEFAYWSCARNAM